MRGLAQDVVPAYGEYAEYDVPVIALVAAKRFPPTQMSNLLSEGLRTAPTALWVVRKSDKHVHDLLAGANLLLLPNRTVPDFELPGCCSRVVVFHLPGSKTEWFVKAKRYWENIVVVKAEDN